MANIAAKRIARELNQIINSEEVAKCGIRVDLVNDNYTELVAEIAGPSDTPYEGGNFVLEIKVPKTYPFNPPKVRFLTNIWHPNIDPKIGVICLDILSNQWAATMTLRTLLLSLQSFLSSPVPDDPLDPFIALQFKETAEMFEITSRHWTNVYAGGPHANKEFDDKIRKLIELGADEHDARLELSYNNWDLHEVEPAFEAWNNSVHSS